MKMKAIEVTPIVQIDRFQAATKARNGHRTMKNPINRFTVTLAIETVGGVCLLEEGVLVLERWPRSDEWHLFASKTTCQDVRMWEKKVKALGKEFVEHVREVLQDEGMLDVYRRLRDR